MRAIGNTKTPMNISIINSALVVFLTYALVYGKSGFPDLGLQGAGWCMVAAEGITLLLNPLVHNKFLNDTFFTCSWVPIEARQIWLLLVESMKL